MPENSDAQMARLNARWPGIAAVCYLIAVGCASKNGEHVGRAAGHREPQGEHTRAVGGSDG